MDACMEVLSTLQNIRGTVIEDYTRSVFLPPCRYTSGEVVIFLMELKRKYRISLEDYTKELKIYSIDELVLALEQQMDALGCH